MDTNSFIVSIETDYICKEVAEDIETRFDTSIMSWKDQYQKERTKGLLVELRMNQVEKS